MAHRATPQSSAYAERESDARTSIEWPDAQDVRFAPGLLVAFIALAALTLIAQERDRSKIPDRYTWNLADLYPSANAWRAAKKKLEAGLPLLANRH